MYPGVPMKTARLREKCFAFDFSAVTAFASPKSMIRGIGFPFTSTTRMFAGFRSR